jgi:Flp pilus assembly protein protease CpaA
MLIEGEYLFLFLLGGMWIVFAVVQDLRTREISNWLTFSLIGIVLAYRAFYSLESGDLDFFLFGVFGVAAFWILGYVFYYGRVFAGGDVKLLRGIGGILPYKNLMDLVFL